MKCMRHYSYTNFGTFILGQPVCYLIVFDFWSVFWLVIDYFGGFLH